MSEYTIKTYRKEFLEEQVRIGKLVKENWGSYGQFSAEYLEKIYSSPIYDTRLRLYCFLWGKMVGYITSHVIGVGDDGLMRGYISYPVVLPNHEEVIDLLTERALRLLQRRGVQIAVTHAGDLLAGTSQWVKDWGFIQIGEVNRIYDLDVSTIGEDEFYSVIKFSEYKPKKDYEALKDHLTLFYGDKGRAEEKLRIVEYDQNNPALFLAHLLIKQDEEIVGRAYVRKRPGMDWARIDPIYAKRPVFYALFISQIVKICKKHHLSYVEAVLEAEQQMLAEEYFKYLIPMGFVDRGIVAMYGIELSHKKEMFSD